MSGRPSPPPRRAGRTSPAIRRADGFRGGAPEVVHVDPPGRLRLERVSEGPHPRDASLRVLRLRPTSEEAHDVRGVPVLESAVACGDARTERECSISTVLTKQMEWERSTEKFGSVVIPREGFRVRIDGLPGPDLERVACEIGRSSVHLRFTPTRTAHQVPLRRSPRERPGTRSAGERLRCSGRFARPRAIISRSENGQEMPRIRHSFAEIQAWVYVGCNAISVAGGAGACILRRTKP